MLKIQVLLKLSIRYLVTFFVLPVALRVILDGVVGKMHERVEVVQLKLEGACTNVALAIPVSPHRLVLH